MRFSRSKYFVSLSFIFLIYPAYSQNSSATDEPVRIPIIVNLTCENKDADCEALKMSQPLMFAAVPDPLEPNKVPPKMLGLSGVREYPIGSGKWEADLFPGVYIPSAQNKGAYALKKVLLGQQDLTPLGVLSSEDVQKANGGPVLTVHSGMTFEPIVMTYTLQATVKGETKKSGKPVGAMIVMDGNYLISSNADPNNKKSPYFFVTPPLEAGPHSFCALDIKDFEIIHTIYPSPLEGWCKAKPVNLKGGKELTLNLEVQPFNSKKYAKVADEIKATHTLAAIKKFIKEGHVFTSREEGPKTSAKEAAAATPEIFEAYLKAGGTFKGRKDNSKITELVASDVSRLVLDNKRKIELFSQYGGTFSDVQDNAKTFTPYYYVLQKPDLIEAYAKAGGKFGEQTDLFGRDAGLLAVQRGDQIIAAYAKAGGTFSDEQDVNGRNAADWVALKDEKSKIVFSDALKTQNGINYRYAPRVGKATVEEGPTCNRRDLDFSYDISDDLAKSETTFALNIRNLSQNACVLRYLNRLMVGNNNGTQYPLGEIAAPYLLNPQKSANVTYRWRSDPNRWMNSKVDLRNHCHAVQSIWGYHLTRSVSEMLPLGGNVEDDPALSPFFEFNVPSRKIVVCSSSAVTFYADGAITNTQNNAQPSKVTFALKEDNSLHATDRVALKLDIADPDKILPLKLDAPRAEDVCGDLKLIQKSRFSDGATSFDEVGKDMKCTVSEDATHLRHVEVSYVTINYGQIHTSATLNDIGTRVIDVSYLKATDKAPNILITSNPLSITFKDKAAKPIVWGSQSQGYVVALKLNKSVYHRGDDIIATATCARLTGDWIDGFTNEFTSPCKVTVLVKFKNGSYAEVVEKNPFDDKLKKCPETQAELMDLFESLKGEGVKQTPPLTTSLNLTKSCVMGMGGLGYLLEGPFQYQAIAIWYPYNGPDNMYAVSYSRPVDFEIRD